ncbi:uncharacterized protein J7T54_003171, partial [Emericellopsis cladophorae]
MRWTSWIQAATHTWMAVQTVEAGPLKWADSMVRNVAPSNIKARQAQLGNGVTSAVETPHPEFEDITTDAVFPTSLLPDYGASDEDEDNSSDGPLITEITFLPPKNEPTETPGSTEEGAIPTTTPESTTEGSTDVETP